MTQIASQFSPLAACAAVFVPDDAETCVVAASRAALAEADRAAEPMGHARRCRDLWQALLMALWQDSFEPEGASPAANREAEAARRWFGSRDFGEVCWLAGLDPAPVHERWLRQQAAWRSAGSPRSSGTRQSRRVVRAEGLG